MTLKTKYVDVVVGKEKTRYTIEDKPEDIAYVKPAVSLVKDIRIDPQTMALLVFAHDGNINTFFGCPYALCQHDDGIDIVVPEIITDVS